MPPLTLPGVRFLDRTVKPVALGLMLSLLSLAWAGWKNTGALGASLWADVIAVACVVLTLGFIVAWLGRWQRLSELSMLASFGVWTFRLIALALLHHRDPLVGSFLIAVGWMIVAAGSYWLEVTDPHEIKRK